jgi:hypothetical protein
VSYKSMPSIPPIALKMYEPVEKNRHSDSSGTARVCWFVLNSNMISSADIGTRLRTA